MLTGRADGFDTAAPGGRPVRLPEPGRVRARHRRELATPRPSLSYADGLAKAYAIRGEDRPRRRGDRRRRAHRRHGLGGAEQHRRRQGPPAGHRRQRQRPLLHARPSAASPTTSTTLRTNPRYEQVLDLVKQRLNARPRRRPGRVRRAARDEEGPQGRPRPAGPLRGPRPEVRRPGRRPRPSRRWSRRCAQAKRFGGPVIVHVHHPQGLRLRRRPSSDEADQFHAPGPVRRRDRRRRTPKGRIWTDVFADEIVAHRRASGQDVVGDHRRDAAPGRARTSSPRAFPDRTFDVGIAEQHAVDLRRRAGDGRAAPGGRGLRDVPQPRLRPGADGRRAAPVRRHVRARPRRRHRRRRRQPQRHVGHVDPPGRARACGSPRRATPTRLRELLREAVEVDDAPTVVRFPKGPPPRRHRAPSAAAGGCRRAASATAPRTC